LMKKYRRSAHAAYEIKYHFVWCPKYRFRILDGEIKSWLERAISEVCEALDVLIVEGHISKDHVHLCVSAPPKLSPSMIAQKIKGQTAERIFREFPQLTKRYWGQHFWARGYFVSTVGIDEATIKKYIKEQSDDDTSEKQMRFWR
jgi:putative transposase